MSVSDIIIIGVIIVWIVVWILIILDTLECRKCNQRYLCMRSTLSHHCPKRNRLSEEERKILKKKIDELDD